MLVGGNPNVALPRQKYLDALTRSSQPTHFAVRLAELAFGDDVLVASTVTGGKRGTMQLDPNVISAIQGMRKGEWLKCQLYNLLTVLIINYCTFINLFDITFMCFASPTTQHLSFFRK